MSKHTPGPWSQAFFINIESDIVQPMDVGAKRWALAASVKNMNRPLLIAGVYGAVPSEADARLIAASPELLVCLEKLTNELEINYVGFMPPGASLDAARKMIKAAREVIAKVKGKK